MEVYLYFPNTPSWRGAQLKAAQGQLYLFTFIPCHVGLFHGGRILVAVATEMALLGDQLSSFV
jgi:hypothetical protein